MSSQVSPLETAVIISVEAPPIEEGPERAVGDLVVLRSTLTEFKALRAGDAARELRGLKAGEAATISFAQHEFGNYKLKRASDETELIGWFRSNELMAKAELDNFELSEAREDIALQSVVEREEAKETVDGDGSEDDIDDIHKDPGKDTPPASTMNKLTSELVKELATHTKSIGARNDILRLIAALSWRCKLPIFGRFNIAMFENLKGETFCLDYLQRNLWREDYLLAGLVLDCLVPCLKASDQCCVRFVSAHGREIVERTMARFSHDKPVQKAGPLVLKHCLMRSARVAKAELCRMRQSLCFCGRCRAHFFEHELYVNSSLEHAISQTVEGGFGAGPGGPYGSYIRGTVAERSLVPSGDTVFWFGEHVVEKYHRGQDEEKKNITPPSNDQFLSPDDLARLRHEALLADDRWAKLRKTSDADYRQVRHLCFIMSRFKDRADVQIAGLEVLLHYAAKGDEEALAKANVAEHITAAMKTHHRGELGLVGTQGLVGGRATKAQIRQLQWRACACCARLATRSEALRAALGKNLTIDECLRVFSRCPKDRAVQQMATFAINYCLGGHSATRTRLLLDPYVVRLVSVITVLKPAEEAVVAKRAARESAEAKARGSAALTIRPGTGGDFRPPSRENIERTKKERRVTHGKSRDGGRPLTGLEGRGTPASRPTTTESSAAPSNSVVSGVGSQKVKAMTIEECARDAISRELVLPVQLRLMISPEIIEAFLHPPKKPAAPYKAPEGPRRLGGDGKAKFGRAQ